MRPFFSAIGMLFFDYHRQYGIPIKVVRIFNTYGPQMLPNDGRVVSNFIVQALKGHDITIYGDGSQTRSFCYVADLVAGLEAMMRTPHAVTGPVNLGNPGEIAPSAPSAPAAGAASGGDPGAGGACPRGGVGRVAGDLPRPHPRGADSLHDRPHV